MIDLLLKMNMLNLLVVLPSIYVMAACVCRIRFGTGTEISWQWAALYYAVALCAVALIATALYGEARWIDALIAITVAAYIHATRHAWENQVPSSARPAKT